METQVNLKKRLERELSKWYPGFNQPLECVLVKRKTFRWSEHLIFQITENRIPVKQILVKLPNLHYREKRQQDINFRPQNGCQLEYEALSLLHEYLGNETVKGITMVRPLVYYSEMDAVVMEYLPGKDFLSILSEMGAFWGKFSNPGLAYQTAFEAGRLLACIHQLPHELFPNTQDLAGLKLSEIVDEKIDRLLFLKPSKIVKEQIQPAGNQIKQYLSQEQGNVLVTKLHGDYYPDNIVRLPNGRVFTVDTTLHQVGPVEQDIAKFLVGTEVTKRYLLFGSLGMDRGLSTKISQTFLEGYKSIGIYNLRVLLVFQFLGLLQRWIEVLEVMEKRSTLDMSPLLEKNRITPSMLKSVGILIGKIETEI